jgi:hypothetical protein
METLLFHWERVSSSRRDSLSPRYAIFFLNEKAPQYKVTCFLGERYDVPLVPFHQRRKVICSFTRPNETRIITRHDTYHVFHSNKIGVCVIVVTSTCQLDHCLGNFTSRGPRGKHLFDKQTKSSEAVCQ